MNIKKVISVLSGHKGSETTEIYTYVSEEDVALIKSPLNSILKGGSDELKNKNKC